MLVKTLDLRNFQKHKNLSLKFSKYLTAIKGTSGVGKSAILRSLFQLVDESIPWNVCHTWDTDDTHIKVIGVVDGKECTVERVHSSDTNAVIIDGKTYEYVGKSTPEILTKTLNIRDQNIQKQKDPWFLIDMKPGQLSKELNSVSGLNIIDASIQEISTRVRNAQSEIRILKAQAVVLDKEIQDLDYIKDADIDLMNLERAEKVLFSAEDFLRKLRAKYDEYMEYQSQMKKIPKNLESDLDALEFAYKNYKELERNYEKISSLSRLNSEVVSKIDTTCPSAEADLNKLVKYRDAVLKAKEEYSKLKGIASICQEAQDDIASIKKSIQTMEEMKSKAESQLGICPMCKRPL